MPTSTCGIGLTPGLLYLIKCVLFLVYIYYYASFSLISKIRCVEVVDKNVHNMENATETTILITMVATYMCLVHQL